jgi:DDE superfamily endonuclease
LTLVAEHRRGHGARYDALAHGALAPQRLRRALADVPLPRATDGRIVLAPDVSPWLRPDAPTSADRLFCHVYGRGRGNAQMIPGRPYSFVAALEPGRSSWTAMLDVVRIGPAQDATAVAAAQLREVVDRLTAAGQWRVGDLPIVIVADAGYDITRLAHVLADLPVELLGRLRSDRVLRGPRALRAVGATGRPPRHGPGFALSDPQTWWAPAQTTVTDTTRYGRAVATAWDGLCPRLTHRGVGRPSRRAADHRRHPAPPAGRAVARGPRPETGLVVVLGDRCDRPGRGSLVALVPAPF